MTYQAQVRPAAEADAEQICGIYNHYVLNSTITFEELPVTPAEMSTRIRTTQSASLPWLVSAVDGQILGYAYAHRWKERAAYRHSTEITVYVRHGLNRGGIGTHLYAHLLPAAKACGMHTAIGGIALPNEASVRLHRKFGFVEVAHFKEVGFKFNRWIDVTYWQVLL